MTFARLVTAVVAIALVAACNPEPGPATPGGDPPSLWETTTERPSSPAPINPVPYDGLQLQVDGDATAETISYGVGMATTTMRDVQLPWTTTVPDPPSSVPSGDSVAVTVQAQLPAGATTGQVSCRISIRDHVWASATQPGGALCTAVIPVRR